MSIQASGRSEFDSSMQVSIPDDNASSSEEIVRFSPNELTTLINKLEDVVLAIRDRRGNEQPRLIRRNSR